MKLLLDEMYPPALATSLHAAGIDAVAIIEIGLAGIPDPGVFAHAVTENRAVVAESVGDFVAIAAQHSTTGAHHPGLVVALSSRSSRTSLTPRRDHRRHPSPPGRGPDDRIVYVAAAAR